MLNNDSEDDMPVQISSDESHFLTNGEYQLDIPSNFINENNQSPDSFSPQSPSLFQTGIYSSWLWKQPKIISQFNLKLFGVKFDSDLSVYSQLKRYNLFSCSKDGKYFIFANEVVVYIFKCIEGWLVKKLKYKTKPDQLLITSDSQYLIVVFKSGPIKQTNKFEVYGLEDLKKYFVKKRETQSDIDFEVKFKQFYAMYIDQNKQIKIEIFNVYKGQSINVIYPQRYHCKLFNNRLFVLNKNVFLKNTKYWKDSHDLWESNCFLQRQNGKVLKKTNNYKIIQDIFGLDTDTINTFFHIYIYYVNTGKLLKKIKAKTPRNSGWFFNLPHPQINLIKLQNELLIQMNFNHLFITSFKFYTVELKCFRFERSRRYYQELEQMNENRAFEIQEDGVIKFYQF